MKKSAQDIDYNAKLGTGGFNPIDTLELRAAVKEGRDSFKVESGKEFSIQYRGSQIFYKPTDGSHTPCGEVDLAHLLSLY